MILPPELSGKPTSSHLVASRRKGEGNDKFGLVKYFWSYLQVIFSQHAVKSYDIKLPALLPVRRKSCCRFVSPKPSPRPGLNPLNLGLMVSTLTITPPR
jgi:hypothetical protein